MKPRLTIAIPTFNRPERLERCIQHVIGSSIPVRCIVADDGDSDEPERVCKQWEDHPNFQYYRSPAKKLWHNWKWAAEKAVEEGCEFFQWCQDDDLIASRHARRVVRSFDYFKDATVYLSRLAMAYDNMLGCHWTGNFGAKIPMDLLGGQPTDFPGGLLLPISYFDSWAMSPAKAFRVNERFSEMLEALPEDCDMFTERLDLCYMGLGAKAISDPGIAGYWIIHGRNESQLTVDKCQEQVQVAFTFLDSLMDQHPEWRGDLMSWIGALGTPQLIKSFWENVKDHRGKSPYAAQIANIFEDVMRGMGMAFGDAEKVEEPKPELEEVAA